MILGLDDQGLKYYRTTTTTTTTIYCLLLRHVEIVKKNLLKVGALRHTNGIIGNAYTLTKWRAFARCSSARSFIVQNPFNGSLLHVSGSNNVVRNNATAP